MGALPLTVPVDDLADCFRPSHRSTYNQIPDAQSIASSCRQYVALNDVSRDTADVTQNRRSVTTSGLVPNERLAAAELLAEWDGCVTNVQERGAYFYATLKGLKGQGVKGEEDDATIPISDVSESDRELLRPGNFFRLCVLHEISSSGQPRRYTQVIFRRLPAYRQQDLDQAIERGRRLARSLRVE